VCGLDNEMWADALTSGGSGAQPKFVGKRVAGASRRLIGVELEFSRFDVDDLREREALRHMTRWGAFGCYDGCVPRGMELVTSPASGTAFFEQAIEVIGPFQMAIVDDACGMHVHVDARDFSWYDVRRMIIAYSRCESWLYSMCSPNRENNHFGGMNGGRWMSAVAKSRDPEESKRNIAYKLYGTADTRSRRNHKYEQARYGGFNLHSWLYRKTFEFRMHHGTKSIADVTNWAQIVAKMVDVAMESTEAELLQGALALLRGRLTPSELEWSSDRRKFFRQLRHPDPARAALDPDGALEQYRIARLASWPAHTSWVTLLTEDNNQ